MILQGSSTSLSVNMLLNNA